MAFWNNGKRKYILISVIVLVLVCSTLVAIFAYRAATTTKVTPIATKIIKTPTITPIIQPFYPPIRTPTSLPSGPVLGVESNLVTAYPGIPWVRFGYSTCGANRLSGDALKTAIANKHSQGVKVLVTTCQTEGASLFNTKTLQDVADSGADAVQCGNEQMKYDPGNTSYIPPADFARYFDLCKHTIRAIRPDMPVLLGSLDPHVGGIDYQPLVNQMNYLNAMQDAMNSIVHLGGHWSWRSETLGLIDSWHNGYPNQSTNSLYGLFLFWAQQFNVNLNSGALGKHLWVVEGTGCYAGCGIDPSSSYQVAVSHILTLITDVQVALQYKVPFFYFSGKDFFFTVNGTVAPFGILDINGHPKPIRQDLPMGARSLVMSCSNLHVVVINQEQLLARLYKGCSLPNNYYSILTS
jgi:hypothetical protein